MWLDVLAYHKHLLQILILIVTSSKALVTSSDALVTSSFLLLIVRHLFLLASCYY